MCDQPGKCSSNSFKFAAIQIGAGTDKALNLQRAASLVAKAAKDGAKVVSLPECFNSPYGTEYFKLYAEKVPDGESCRSLASMARQNQIYLIGGSIPEADGDNLYNTCTIWGPTGDLIGKHRKVHLFDVSIPGKIHFQESEALTPGCSYTTFDTPFCKIGVGICYDICFAELAGVYAQKGCKVLVYPGAFSMITGPTHWELHLRSRAVDNQIYVVGAAPARVATASYVAWGHSSVVDPWGTVLTETDEKEGIVQADIDLDFLEDVRNQIPFIKQKRLDMYETVEKTQ
ncbi:omega-amidase NIT2-like [Artemia franciscana]|uniref:omega-amidase n=1 Tax=Artemia franciscana TaxID=6661 RepID=A0AA88HJZ3_ARTSF|nr:hypothetical protein QYM36_012083 [Artemia franciscana]